jgi:hypothetical protein
MPFFCCMTVAGSDCYSQATGITDVQVFAAGPTCSGDGVRCGCTQASVDGHEYALTCTTAAGCTCTKDGITRKSLPDLCPTGGALDSNYLLWACGFPPL